MSRLATIKTAACLLIVAFSAVVVTSARAENTQAEEAAIQCLKRNAEDLANFAYPSVTQKSQVFVNGTRYASGAFDLDFKYNSEWDGQTGSVTLRYNFTKEGRLTGIRELNRSWFLPAFSEGELLAGLLKAALLQNEELTEADRRAIKSASFKGLIIIGINLEM